MSYYIIPDRVMKNIDYYVEKGINDNISFQDNELLKTLNVDLIHFNEDNIIDKFMEIFQHALQNEENNDELHEIIEALKQRKSAVQTIIMDVLKKSECFH